MMTKENNDAPDVATSCCSPLEILSVVGGQRSLSDYQIQGQSGHNMVCYNTGRSWEGAHSYWADTHLYTYLHTPSYSVF